MNNEEEACLGVPTSLSLCVAPLVCASVCEPVVKPAPHLAAPECVKPFYLCHSRPACVCVCVCVSKREETTELCILRPRRSHPLSRLIAAVRMCSSKFISSLQPRSIITQPPPLVPSFITHTHTDSFLLCVSNKRTHAQMSAESSCVRSFLHLQNHED